MTIKSLLLKLIILILFIPIIYSQNLHKEQAFIGAQVVIEPGQTDEEIEGWFKILNEQGLSVCRIRMFETYMHDSNGEWDYSLFDKAFIAAEKYDIKIFATLFPDGVNNSVGGFKFPHDEEHFKAIANYIEHLVTHFKQYKSLYGWVLLNEPGTGGWVPKDDFTNAKYDEWLKNQSPPAYNSKGYTTNLANFNREKFLLDYTTWFLGWIAAEIQKYDPERHLHVNNHNIFSNAAEYNFPEWSNFLTTLGVSAHASWHFKYFNRNDYTLAMMANCDIIRSGAGNIPFLVTELQGGNNTYSGYKAFCPTQEETEQWLWASIGAGAKGIIFWSLNPRSIGEEAGEWALLNFQNKPSDRLIASAKINTCLTTNKELFNQALPINSGINILYIRESMWIEKKVQNSGAGDEHEYEGRMNGGVMKSSLSYYKTLAENGINSEFKEINEFDWSKSDYSGITIILANQVSIPSYHWGNLENFVSKGGKLIVDGLTAFYDENMLSLPNTGFPLENLFGGTLSEVICIPGDFDIQLDNKDISLHSHLWKGYIQSTTGETIASENDHILAIRNSFGKGQVLWIPSMLGMGNWRNYDSQLSNFILPEVSKSLTNLPLRFKTMQSGITMRTMQSGNSLITIIINKNPDTTDFELSGSQKLKPSLIYSSKQGKISETKVSIEPEEVMVIEWK